MVAGTILLASTRGRVSRPRGFAVRRTYARKWIDREELEADRGEPDTQGVALKAQNGLPYI